MKNYSWHNQPEQQHQFGGGGAPKQSKVQKENEQLNNKLLRQQLEQIGKEPEVPVMAPLPAQPKFAPPPSATPADAESASREAQRRTRMRRGLMRSKLGAGDTGAPTTTPIPSPVSQGAKPTLG